MFRCILFDLDGTLTDPKEGITKSVQFALGEQGIKEPDLDRLEPFIGPPLEESFMEFYGMTQEAAKIAVADYRKRFAPIGIFENKVYPGIPGMLERLKAAGIKLAVASSKPEVYVKRILEHFELAQYFDVITGSELNGIRGRKEEVVEEALRRLGEKTDKITCAMVGDRRFDIEGAKEHGLTAVGVSYGYAGKGELEKAGADHIAGTVKELEDFLLQKPSKRRKGIPALSLFLLAVSGSLGINILFSLLHITENSSAYQQTAKMQYQIPFLSGILLYGLISPLAEELFFRRGIYCFLKKHMKIPAAMILSSLLFGLYHGNVVQAFYAALLGMLIVSCYEECGRFFVPFFIHSIANITVFSVTYDEEIGNAAATWSSCVIFLLIFAVTFFKYFGKRIYKKNP